MKHLELLISLCLLWEKRGKGEQWEFQKLAAVWAPSWNSQAHSGSHHGIVPSHIHENQISQSWLCLGSTRKNGHMEDSGICLGLGLIPFPVVLSSHKLCWSCFVKIPVAPKANSPWKKIRQEELLSFPGAAGPGFQTLGVIPKIMDLSLQFLSLLKVSLKPRADKLHQRFF